MKKTRRRIEDMNEPPVFTHCNVCGRQLIYQDEDQIGMCDECAYGWQEEIQAEEEE